eukprot:TRINITY_DN21466_c0_g1_i1.p1 TRINITY_DN21466_c0_g1~~TRINITY_DN21466_c0_g1_i1.p1  ORF type:complete len:100 (-),score=12.18 TRINITY_DN21466_c0_g1_i1:419-718(-)
MVAMVCLPFVVFLNSFQSSNIYTWNHPGWHSLVQCDLVLEIDPCAWFIEIILWSSEKPRVLVSECYLPTYRSYQELLFGFQGSACRNPKVSTSNPPRTS